MQRAGCWLQERLPVSSTLITPRFAKKCRLSTIAIIPPAVFDLSTKEPMAGRPLPPPSDVYTIVIDECDDDQRGANAADFHQHRHSKETTQQSKWGEKSHQHDPLMAACWVRLV
jgi:hypothetical protein